MLAKVLAAEVNYGYEETRRLEVPRACLGRMKFDY